ncbi:hypothetical protein ATY75_03460 [Rhizobium sp. N122]|uniref:hypothetical protein n=1 Tax=Rhizobium sp. N122 TaxID=1764272 RepID=UPI000B5A7D2D|nr:hypothetical protein [Rhizobium sp. N122]OWV87378.1 hypothetical protein ATY75_03460 [Rhizobium sp. N122]
MKTIATPTGTDLIRDNGEVVHFSAEEAGQLGLNVPADVRTLKIEDIHISLDAAANALVLRLHHGNIETASEIPCDLAKWLHDALGRAIAAMEVDKQLGA